MLYLSFDYQITCGGHCFMYTTRNGITPAIKWPMKGIANIVFRKLSERGPDIKLKILRVLIE